MKEQYSHSGNVTAKSVDEVEIDVTENAQDSASEDDSDDDSDRKGTLKYVTFFLYIYRVFKKYFVQKISFFYVVQKMNI